MLNAELLGQALELAPDAILIVDATGKILFASSRLQALLGYAPAELIGQHIESLLPPRLRERHARHRNRYLVRPEARPMGTNLDLSALHKDGREVAVEISLNPVRGNGAEGLTAAALRDATAWRRNRQALVEARESADRANEAKSRFLATASHDLRQPLQTLALLNGALRRMVNEPDVCEALAHQETAIATMSRLLNALLDISKLESGAIRPEPADFAVAGLFKELGHDLVEVAASKGLVLSVAAGEELARTDRELLGQILRNLLSNAIKFTPSGSVELRCQPSGQGLRIEVIDTGIGIAADQLAHIYDEFYQVGIAGNATREGYGLGLSIVRRAAALLGIPIEVRSQPGHGTIFSLDVPRGEARAPAAEERAALGGTSGTARRSPQVLLVEDDAGVRAATSMLLSVEGYRVVPAASHAEALARARDEPGLALLVTDYHLPGGATGTQVIADVRALLDRPLPAVLVTGDTSAVPHVDSTRVHQVSKPVNAEELLELLATLLAE